MNKKFMWMSALVVSMSLSQMPIANADDAMYPCQRMQKIEKELDLTADQKSKIKTIKATARENLKDKLKAMHDIRQQINEQIKAGSPDQSKIDSLVTQETDILGTIIKGRISVRQQIFVLLTDAQKTKFSDMVNKWEEKHLKNQEEKEHQD